MIPIFTDKISKDNDGNFVCECLNCKSTCKHKTKSTCTSILRRGSCSHCVDRHVKDNSDGIYLNDNNKWCSSCNSCGKEQAYTRKDHARGSYISKRLCRRCANYSNVNVGNAHIDGFRKVDFTQFQRQAKERGISWEIDAELVIEMWNSQQGKCALSGMSMVKHPRTWSIDRIDNSGDYTPDNIQLVDKRVNMMKGQLHNYVFIDLCRRISANNEV